MYTKCFISLDDCLFSLTYFALPFNDFEIGILNYLLITRSQLYLVSLAYD